MEKLSLTCPKCHGTMEVNENKTEMFCPYCRNKIIIDDDIDKKAERIKKITYAREEGERLAEEAAQKRNDKINLKKKIRYSSKRHIGGLISAGNPSAWSPKDGYTGSIWGFYSVEELESFIKNNEFTDVTMKVYSE